MSMSKPRDQMTDEDHIRYMLDGGDRGIIEKLWEMKDSWGFGGGVWLAKEHPLVKFGVAGPSKKDEFLPLNASCRFEATPFHLADTGARGLAVWFQWGPRDERSCSLDNRTLCGWVRPEREADVTEWLRFLNELVAAHIAKRQAAWDAMTDEQRQDAISAAHFEASRLAFERLGIPMPRDMNELEKWAKADAPIDGRRKEPPDGPGQT
jgi:hypothetical protein